MNFSSKRLSRRTLVRGTFAAGLGGGLLATLGAVGSFLYPSSRGRSRVRLGSLRSFPVGSKTLFKVIDGTNDIRAERILLDLPMEQLRARAPVGRAVWLVRLEQGFLALSNKCTHLGCAVPWRSDSKFYDPSGTERTGWFRCPCHGATFDDAGVRVYGPVPRSLDRYELKIVGSDVFLDYGRLWLGTADNRKFAVDPEGKET